MALQGGFPMLFFCRKRFYSHDTVWLENTPDPLTRDKPSRELQARPVKLLSLNRPTSPQHFTSSACTSEFCREELCSEKKFGKSTFLFTSLGPQS